MDNNENQEFKEGTLDFSDINKLIDNGTTEPEDTLKLEDLKVEPVGDEVKGTEDIESNKDTEDIEGDKKEEDNVNLQTEEKAIATDKQETSELGLDYNSIKNKLIEKGIWEDVTLKVGEDEEDLSTMEALDEETFLAILEEQNKIKEDVIKNSSINKDGLDDMTLKLIEISKAGGDITDIVKQYDEYVNPLNGLNLQDVKVQEALIVHQLKRQRLDPDIIESSIKTFREKGLIGAKANEIVQNTNKIFNKYLDDKEVEAKEKKKEESDRHVQFKSDLSAIYKDEYGLDDKATKRLTKFGSNKEFLDNRYKELMSDPKKASELIYFMEDPESYLKYKSVNKDRSDKIKTLRTINIIQKDKGATSSKSTDDKKKKTSSSFSFEEIKD